MFWLNWSTCFLLVYFMKASLVYLPCICIMIVYIENHREVSQIHCHTPTPDLIEWVPTSSFLKQSLSSPANSNCYQCWLLLGCIDHLLGCDLWFIPFLVHFSRLLRLECCHSLFEDINDSFAQLLPIVSLDPSTLLVEPLDTHMIYSHKRCLL